MDKWRKLLGRVRTSDSERYTQPRSFTEVSTEDFAGEYGFELVLLKLQYSQILNRLYCLKGIPYPVLVRVCSPPPPRSIIRAMTVYNNGVADVVEYAKKASGHRTDVPHLEHPIQVEGNQHARYFTDKKTAFKSVTVPYESPEEGSLYTIILYRFMCLRGCVSCTCWQNFLIVITLESQKGQILGRSCFEVRVSSMPGLDLMRDEGKALEEKTIVYENQLELIRCVSNVPEVLHELVGDVLNRAQYKDIMCEPTDVLRMQKLFEEVLIRNERYQVCFYLVLQKTNRGLTNKLFGGHFLERHQKKLIEKVSRMGIVLPRLLGFVLNDDDYHCIGTEKTDAGKMAKLFELMPGWDRAQKDQLYQELIETNGLLITSLEAKAEEYERQPEVYEAYSSPFMSNGEHFVERHQEELIRCAVGVDVIVESLEICAVITFNQMQDIGGTSQQRMQKLYKLMPKWTTSQKDQMCEILRCTNRRLLMQLEGGHFVDRHLEELIEQVTVVPLNLNLLLRLALDEVQDVTDSQCTTEKMQMKALFQMVQELKRQQKDELYQDLVETNPNVVKVLEEEHFIEKHEEEVIWRTCRVNTVLRWLHDPHLQWITEDQHSLIKADSDHQKMRDLYKLVPKWNRKQKDHLYAVLKKTNGPLIADLEEGHFVERHKEYLMKSITGVRTVASSLRKQFTITHRLYAGILRKDTTKEIMEAIYEMVPSWNGEQKNNLYRAFRRQNASLIKELESKCEDSQLTAMTEALIGIFICTVAI
ncbi:uncharacterized protein LOC132583310 [Heteronotia binoei]|uniref:uncharacterized protein LOC132583310 n=1 Tax=Heteronotia binoei TaxID=13085 RepID=UPI00292D37F4|nr:uncharacterized protein LOC132583310 [Heteronotia binoei]